MKRYIIFGLVTLFALISCNKNELLENNIPKQKTKGNKDNIVNIDLTRPYREMVLGDVIKNPFSVENMQKGKELMYEYLDDLKKFGITKDYLDKFKVETTDLYVRFLPVDMAEMSILEADTNLILFEHPLHREIIEDGDYYIDEDLPKESNLIWLYSVVPYDYNLDNGVQYEVIEPLFLPEHSPQFPLYDEWLHTSKEIDPSEFWYNDLRTPLENDFRNALTNAAFRAAGYEENDRAYNHSQYEQYCDEYYIIFKSWSWTYCSHKIYPQGRLLIQTPTGTTGLSGVQISIWRWYRLDRVYTDGAGYFYDPDAWEENALFADDYIGYKIRMNGKRGNNSWSFKDKFVPTHTYKIGYRLLWESPHFTLTTSVSDTWGRGVLSNAIYDYCLNAEKTNMTLPPSSLRIASWYKSGLGSVSTPLLNQGVPMGFSVSTLKGLILGSLISVFGSVPMAIISLFDWDPDMIMVFDNNIGNYYEMTATMWHELSHTSHFNTIKNNISQNAALEYWYYVVSYEAGHTLDYGTPYGNKGDVDWERIALTEGWGKFREWYLGIRYLNYYISSSFVEPIGYYDANEFNYEFAGMFTELYNNANCSMQNLEKSLSASTLNAFTEKLLQLEPTTHHSAINTIMLKYNP